MPWTVYNREGQRKYLTSPEIDAFLEASASFSEDIETFGGILTYTGCRISEALTMTAENIDFVAGMIIIRSLKKRGKTIFRAIPVPAQFLARLRRWLNTLPSGQEFLWPWSRMTGYRYICKVMDKARVSGAFATPKGLRHGFGVKAIQSGVPLTLVQRWLGHADIKTTAIYTSAIGPEERQIASRMWRSSVKQRQVRRNVTPPEPVALGPASRIPQPPLTPQAAPRGSGRPDSPDKGISFASINDVFEALTVNRRGAGTKSEPQISGCPLIQFWIKCSSNYSYISLY